MITKAIVAIAILKLISAVGIVIHLYKNFHKKAQSKNFEAKPSITQVKFESNITKNNTVIYFLIHGFSSFHKISSKKS